MKLNCKIPSSRNKLDILNKFYSWIPSGSMVSTKKDKKVIDAINYQKNYYQSNVDLVLIKYFNLPGKINRETNKVFSKLKLSELKLKTLVKNEFPYMIPKNTEQYIMWYTYNNITDNEITSDINELLEKLLNHNNFEFVWYENPKMSIPEVFHLQVFWHLV